MTNTARKDYAELEVRVPKTDVIQLLGALSPSTFKVYMALQSWADFNDKSSYPAVNTIAQRCSLSERTVRSSLKELEQCGAIRIEKRKDASGRQTSSTYWIQRVAKSSTPPANDDDTGCKKRHEPGANFAPKETPSEEATEEGEATGENGNNLTPQTSPKPLPANGPEQKIVKAFCEAVGVAQPANYSKAIGQAKTLLKTGVQPDEIPTMVTWARKQWFAKGGFGIGDLARFVEEYRTSQASRTIPASTEDDPWVMSPGGVMKRKSELPVVEPPPPPPADWGMS